MAVLISGVAEGSPAFAAGIRGGDTLLAINGHTVRDVLDYGYYSAADTLYLAYEASGRRRLARIIKRADGQTGLSFDTYLMDRHKRCRNKCVFCFVDQLPAGLRPTLYVKDDDARLSFLHGNYISGTNLSPGDVRRIIKMKISPINLSVHTLSPELRAKMMGNPAAAGISELMLQFKRGGVAMNGQIVLCPGLNDGEELRRTLRGLAAFYPALGSVSVVPVGLTKHRDGLYPIAPVSREGAIRALDAVDREAKLCAAKFGARLFYCSDEMYLRAVRAIPPARCYGGFPQLENGVGTMALMKREFRRRLHEFVGADSISARGTLRRVNGTSRTPSPTDTRPRVVSVATGLAAAPFLQKLAKQAEAAATDARVTVNVCGVENRFFGSSVDVAGLLTGGDLLAALKGRSLGEALYIPSVMLQRTGEVPGADSLFLDGMTVAGLSAALGLPVIPADCGGETFFKICTGIV